MPALEKTDVSFHQSSVTKRCMVHSRQYPLNITVLWEKRCELLNMVLHQATSSDLNVVNPSALCSIDLLTIFE